MLPIAILAGGLGTRLLPVTNTLPKALVQVAGRPFVARQLEYLRSQGIVRAVFCVSYLGDMIEAYVGNGAAFDMEVAYSYDGDQRIGTAGALKRALPLLGDAFFSIYGDSYLTCDYAAVERAFEASAKLALMTVYSGSDATLIRNTQFRDGRVLAYDKMSPSVGMEHIDYGLSVFRKEAFDHVPSGTPTDLGTVFQRLAADGQLAGYESRIRFFEVGTPQGIAEMEAMLKRREPQD